MVKNKKQTEHGASLVEYALLLALIAVVGIPAITAVGVNSEDVFNDVGNQVANAGMNPIPLE